MMVAVEHARTTGSDTRDACTSLHTRVDVMFQLRRKTPLDATRVCVSVPTSAHVLSAFPKNSEDEVLFWRRFADFLDHMPMSRCDISL